MNGPIHEGKKPHECNSCGKTFTSIQNLKQHLDVKHGGKNTPQQFEHIDLDLPKNNIHVVTKINSEKVETGLNYKTTQRGKSIVFHANDGFNYLRSRINSTGTTVFLR